MSITSTNHRGLAVLSAVPPVPHAHPPLLFVHGLGHEAGCWRNWLGAAADAGYRAHALSLRGHGASGGNVLTARLSDYVRDVESVMSALPQPPVLVGHSMGGLVVQRVLARRRVPAAVLVAPVGHRPAIGSFLSVLRRHPGDAARMVAGATLPMRTEYLFEGLSPKEAAPLDARCGPESPIAQHQLLLHRPPPLPAEPVRTLVLGARDDRLVPIADVRRTAARYGADLHELNGIGHNLMQDRGWERPFRLMVDWLATAQVRT